MGKITERAAKIKNDIPALYLAFKNQDTPWYAKAMAIIAVGYALSPIDLIPDFVPILGYIDDLIIIPVLATIAIKLIPQEVLEKAQKESEDVWKDGRPKKWYYAIPIAILWLVIILIIAKSFYSCMGAQ